MQGFDVSNTGWGNSPLFFKQFKSINMETIVTNQNALEKRINSEVKRAFDECKKAADDGRTYIFFKTDRDIQFDVRETLEKNHNIWVPTIYSMDSSPSRKCIEHYIDITEMKLNW